MTPNIKLFKFVLQSFFSYEIDLMSNKVQLVLMVFNFIALRMFCFFEFWASVTWAFVIHSALILAVLEQCCRDDVEVSCYTVASTTFFKSFQSQNSAKSSLTFLFRIFFSKPQWRLFKRKDVWTTNCSTFNRFHICWLGQSEGVLANSQRLILNRPRHRG